MISTAIEPGEYYCPKCLLVFVVLPPFRYCRALVSAIEYCAACGHTLRRKRAEKENDD